MKAFSILVAFVFMLCLPLNFNANEPSGEISDDGPKVTICHIPPGNPANWHAITVSINAIPAHLAHGDSLGDCECEGEECPDDDDGR